MDVKKQATIVDVAKKAGVSVATVSRVVNGNYPVKQDTKERVKAAISSLNYVPNVQARELNTRKSSTIGVVVPGLHNMFFAEVIDGIEDAVRQDGFSFLLNCAKNDPVQEMNAINALVARNVSGIIVISPNTKNISERFYEELVARVPLVFINGYHRIKGVSYVGNDEKMGSQMALAYLSGLGHKDILFVRGANSDSYDIKEEAYRQFMEEKNSLREDY
ncbi:MAG: LacI family DNA-binding transcriptional regulator, partial [Selenomonas sp.]|nr:LacI family DNA-binding transcriptional regulator [Selenomonas sp.]